MSLIAYLGILALALALAIVFLAVLARLNGTDDEPHEDGPPTIIIPPAEPDPEPMGDQVDVRAILHRYAGD